MLLQFGNDLTVELRGVEGSKAKTLATEPYCNIKGLYWMNAGSKYLTVELRRGVEGKTTVALKTERCNGPTAWNRPEHGLTAEIQLNTFILVLMKWNLAFLV